jgi:hypothetical protein
MAEEGYSGTAAWRRFGSSQKNQFTHSEASMRVILNHTIVPTPLPVGRGGQALIKCDAVLEGRNFTMLD